MPPKRKSQTGGKGLEKIWESSDNSKSSTSKVSRGGKKIQNGMF